MKTNATALDKILFAVVVLVGLGFLLIDKTAGVDQTVGIAVTIGGLIGLISAHSLAAVFTMLEKGFLPTNTSSNTASQTPQQKSL